MENNSELAENLTLVIARNVVTKQSHALKDCFAKFTPREFEGLALTSIMFDVIAFFDKLKLTGSQQVGK